LTAEFTVYKKAGNQATPVFRIKNTVALQVLTDPERAREFTVMRRQHQLQSSIATLADHAYPA
jgi:hypothetical protein